jgi:transcriptional regulator with XRE-family HTH domain
MNDLLKNLVEEFTDPEYAHAYMESHAVSRLAAQIYALRKQREWSQEYLAKESGIAQETISKIESADFSSITMKTLHKFCRAFDVDLRIAFEPFSKGILDVINLKPEKLKVCSRSEDLLQFNSKPMHTTGDGVWQLMDDLNFPNVSVVYLASGEEALYAPKAGEWQELSSANMCSGAC